MTDRFVVIIIMITVVAGDDDPVPSGRFGPEEGFVGQGHDLLEVDGLVRGGHAEAHGEVGQVAGRRGARARRCLTRSRTATASASGQSGRTMTNSSPP